MGLLGLVKTVSSYNEVERNNQLLKKYFGSGFLGFNKCGAKTKSFLLQLKEAVMCNIHSELRLRKL